MRIHTFGVFAAALLSVLSLAACGGGGGDGGGGGGSSSGDLSVSISPHQVSQTASTSDPAPSATIQISLSGTPAAGVYVGYNTTNNGIAAVNFASSGPTTANVIIAFDPPSQLGAGVYDDTLQIAVCYDQNCTMPLNGSPQTISVEYTVTAGGSSSGGGSSSSGGPIGFCGGCGLTVVNLPANDLAYDSTHGLFYLSVPSFVGAPQGNTITAIDPSTGAITATQFAGSEPGVLSISDDGQFLYAGIDGASGVQRFKLPGLEPDNLFSLPADSFFGPSFALDLQAAPGAAHTVAVSRGYSGVSPSYGGLSIYDDGVARPDSIKGFSGSGYLLDSVQWGADATALYGANTEDTGFDFYAISVDANGATLQHDYPNSIGGFGDHIHYEKTKALIYTDSGKVLLPATGQPVGSFNASGPMIPDASTGSAYFSGQTSQGYSIDVFDLDHFVQTAFFTFSGGDDAPARLLRWGGKGLALNTRDGPVYLITPGGSGTTSVPAPGGVTVGNASQITAAVQANDIVWDASHQLIYASVPSAASSNGNSIVAIDPATGNIVASQFAGSEPDQLAMSNDGQYLYASLDGAASVQRFKLPGLTPDLNIPLGSGSLGSYYAHDLQVDPDQPGTIAVSLAVKGYSPSVEDLGIFDGAVRRGTPGSIPVGSLYDSLQWAADGKTLYAVNNETTGFDFYVLAVGPAGVTQSADYGGDSPGFYGRIHYDAGTGLVYGDYGSTVVPATGLSAGVFQASGLMVPDSSIGAAFFLGQSQTQFGSGSYTLESFDLSHYTPQQEIEIDGVSAAPRRLIRWGSNGLAFNAGNSVYLVNGDFVSTPAASAAKSARTRHLPRPADVKMMWDRRKVIDASAPPVFLWTPRR